ncbi:hypothetical protein BJX65DRAFT_312302 [Aspergillus insuetus]
MRKESGCSCNKGKRDGTSEDSYLVWSNIIFIIWEVTLNNHATGVIAQARATFPTLRFCLLVGIRGGVPTTTDNGMIRLGDVIVSKAVHERSGALQYDHGKPETGRFTRTGVIAPRPAVLLGAANALAAPRARSVRDPILENIHRINTDIRGLRRYMRPGADLDYLYRAEYAHLNPHLSCA